MIHFLPPPTHAYFSYTVIHANAVRLTFHTFGPNFAVKSMLCVIVDSALIFDGYI